MNTVADAVRDFSTRGYTGGFRAEEDGLREISSNEVYRPERLQIDDLARFEGASDPDDQTVVFALREPESGVRGTYVVAFGAYTDPLDARAMHRLRDARSEKRPPG